MGNTINYYIFSKNLKIIINNQSCEKLTKLDSMGCMQTHSCAGDLTRSALSKYHNTKISMEGKTWTHVLPVSNLHCVPAAKKKESRPVVCWGPANSWPTFFAFGWWDAAWRVFK